MRARQVPWITAGTGKTHVMAAFARVWEDQRAGRVIGLTASTNAARVMADEAAKAGARMETCNLAQFLGKIKGSSETRGHVPVYPGDVLVVDEATQVSTEDALRIAQIARRCGAMVIGTFDPEQLGSVDAGGIFPLIAARHGSYRLTEVRRFTSAWEREASLKLREGDITALAEYAGRGRIYHGPQDRVYDDAVSLYLNGFLEGQEALLMATSNEAAARLSALVRERLAELGRVGEAQITLADGNQAGRGDLIRARLNTRIDADGQTLANRDVIRVEKITRGGFGRLAAVVRQTGPDQWSRPFFVPVAYLESDAELAYAGNVHVAQGRTVDRGHLVVDGGANRSSVYVGATRAREKNTIHVVTGPPDPAQPTRAEREAYAAAQLRRAAALRKAGRPDLAREVPLRMPDRPSDLQLAPWEAVLAQALQQDQPERTALEVIQSAQDFTTHGGHVFQLRQAFWHLDVVPKIDEMVRQRIPAAEYERYMKDPERPAFLQALREHEIGGRRIEDVLDSITAGPLDGLRSIAAGLHGRAGKEPPPVRGATKTWAERTPAQASAEIQAADRMADQRQAELGHQIAAQAPEWAVRAWGRPPAEPGALQDDWRQRAGLVGYYREIAGVTDPAQAIGPVPSGQADLAELFRASVRALQLPDGAALLKAMNQGQLEAAVDAHDRAAALAPPDVQADIDQRAAEWEDAQVSAHIAGGARDADALAEAEGRARAAAADLARLAVADAARREWVEAHAGLAARAEDAGRELRSRGLAERIPVTDAEVAQAAEGGRETPPMGPELWAQLKAEQTARFQADREAERERMARLTPVTDAEVDRYGGRLDPEVSPEAARELAELRQALRDEHRAERAGQAEALARLIPVTDAEVERYGGERPGDGPRPDPETWAAEKADQAGQRRAEREAEAARIGRLIPVTGAEVAAAAAQLRDYPAPDPAEVARWRQEQAGQAAQARERERTIEAEPEAGRETPHVDPGAWAAEKAAQTEQRRAEREARAEASARLTPVTDAEVERYGGERDVTPERAADEANLDEVRAELERFGELIDRIPDREAERQARRAEMLAEPGIRPEPEAEPSLEASWQPGEADGRTSAEADADFEMEIG